MFLSIFAATCRPNNIVPFLNNLAETADDPSSFEVLLKLDEGANELIQIIEDYKKTATISIKYLATAKLDGYYTLDVGYNELLKIIHPNSYFCWLLTDEIRFETKGWDSKLKTYIGFYPDDIFRIKMSIFAYKNYHDFFECLPCPDNYAVTTRKWLEITDGWGQFWGPDSWHQCVDYYLGLCRNTDNSFGTWRSIPIHDIKVAGQEAGVGVEEKKAVLERSRRIIDGWNKHSTHQAQENFNRLAQRLNLHIQAYSLKKQQYLIREDRVKKQMTLYDKDGQYLWGPLSFRLPRLSIKLISGNKKLKLIHFINPYAPIYYKLYCFYKKTKFGTGFRLTQKFISKQITLTRQLRKKYLKNLYHSLPKSFTYPLKTFFTYFQSEKPARFIDYLYDGKCLQLIGTAQDDGN